MPDPFPGPTRDFRIQANTYRGSVCGIAGRGVQVQKFVAEGFDECHVVF